MGLQNIFEMAKADRYTADGREELAKAREADVEDRTYNIGEISQKTGLQKTANGWVKPAGNKAVEARGEKEASSGLTNAEGKLSERGRYAYEKHAKSLSSESLQSLIRNKNKAFVKHNDEIADIFKKELESRNGGGSSEAPKMTPEQRKKWEDKAANPSETTASLRNQIKAFEKDPVTNPHSKEIVDIYKKELAKRENDPNYRPEKLYDSAPRALTGDCKVRVRK